MRIYTSYWGNAKKLAKEDVEPVAICHGKPKWFNGRAEDRLAPTWPMMQLPLERFWTGYREMLESLDPEEIAKAIWDGRKAEAVALMCYEKDAQECHRHVTAEWFNENGIEVVEWEPAKIIADRLQMSLL